MNKSMRLSEHFTLGEMCKTKYVTADGNIPSHVVIENLIRICGWLEELRVVAGVRPRSKVDAGVRPQSKVGCAVDAGVVAGVVAGVRPQSKVAGDCTLRPDPGAALDPRPAGSAARAEAGAAAEARKEEGIVINSG